MDPFIQDIGAMDVQMAEENFSMLMPVSMTVNGSIIKNKDKENIRILQDQIMLDNGRMICFMDTESKHGQMDPNMKEIIKNSKNRGKVNIFGLIIHFMMETGMMAK